MSFVKILVPVAGAGRDRFALATAFAAAKPFNAHVVALFVHADPREAVPYGGASPVAGHRAGSDRHGRRSGEGLVESRPRHARNPGRGSGHPHRRRAAKADAVTVSYDEVTGHLPRALDREALLCDLVVFPPIRETDDSEIQDGFIRALTKLERPVLLSAEKAPEQIGRKVAVGWDGGVACAHALMSALPYLKKAEAIEILTVQNGSHQGRGVESVAAYLALHGLSCSQRMLARGERNVAEVLLETAADNGCDMLVAGGYGHSRLMESIFGGVTEHIVSHPKIPVFMMH